MSAPALETPHSDSLPDSFFRSLAEISDVGIAVYDEEQTLYLNPAMADIAGHPLDGLVAMGPLDLVHPDDRERIGVQLAQRMRGERPEQETFEVRILTADGDVRWLQISTHSIRWRERPAAMATVVDVTERKRTELELREIRERHDLAQTAARYVTWEWDAETDALYVDPKVEQVYGLSPERIGTTGQEFVRRVVHPDDRQVFQDAMEQVRRGEAGESFSFSVEVRFVLPDGEVRWVGERARLLPAAEGDGERVIGVATDISERKRVETALQAETERAQVTLASIGDGVIRTDADGRVDYMNPVAERLTGWSAGEAAGRPLMEVYRLVDETTRKRLADPLAACLGQRRVVELPGTAVLLHRDGREYAVQDSAAPILGRDGRITGAVLVFKDVTHLRGMEQEVSYLVTHDPLTGLINRHEFERLVEAVMEGGEGTRRHALSFLDLDEFKLINDTCGHLAGDELLQQVAEGLSAAVPPGATLARLGGDEFGLLLRDVSPRRAREVVDEMTRAVRETRFEWEDRVFNLGVSAGLVTLPSPTAERAAEALSAADAACYIAKEEGRNRVHEYEPEDARLAERYGEMHWIHRIHKAFDEERFCLHRQRIEPLHGGLPLAEIFIRMRDEDDDLIYPGQFIPAAERFHLIPVIDRWVARTAFRHLATVQADEPYLSHTLNVSGQSLGDERFLADVVRELEDSGADPRRICFEVTETAAVTHLARANRFINVLRNMGCRFVLDDFGSGLSSFAYLKNLQVDYLKVAGEFVRGLAGNEVQWALVRSIHQLGHLMGMRTIAEGVETKEELETVRQIGFDYVQGYHLERPQPFVG